MNQKPKVIKGKYIKNPCCIMCREEVSHDWLMGDYTLILCPKEKCQNEYAEWEQTKELIR